MKVRFQKVLKEKGNDESCYLLCELLDGNQYTMMVVELFDDENSINFIDMYDIKLLAYVHNLDGVAKNKDEFMKKNDNHFNYESFIPFGAFPIPEHENEYKPEPVAYINATIADVFTSKECNAPDNILPFNISLFDNTINACIVYPDAKTKKEKLKKGNIITATIWLEIISIEKQPPVS